MGSIIVEQITTADGFAAAPDGALDFFEVPDPETDDVDHGQLELLRSVDAILLGAETYRMFASFWPTPASAGEPVAEPINRLPKHVVSSTLDAAPWGEHPPATIERGDAVEAARRVADAYDGATIVWGSLALSTALLEAGVVDRLRVRIVPALLGSGRPYAGSLTSIRPLGLRGVTTSTAGHVMIDYDVR